MNILERAKNWFKKEPTPIVDKIVELPNRLQDAESDTAVKISKITRVINPVLSYKNRRGLGDFEEAEYDMAEIGRIEDVESMVQRAFSLKEGLFFKEGYELIGKNASVIQYIKARFAQFSQAANIPFDLTLHGIGEDLVRFHNSILVKVRNAKASGGKLRIPAGKKREIQPVAAYFGVPFPTVKFCRDDNGTILSYRQQLPNGKYKDFAPDDVIHFYFRRKKGFLVGTPVLVSVKDDIRALRRIEENIEMLIYQCLFPLFQYSVGTVEKPCKEYSDGTTEVDVVKANIEIMPSEGMIVTPERHEIKAVGAEGRALRAEGYVNHFKERIIGGLGISAIDLGQGNTANRSCYSEDTETLTDNGWKFYWQITPEDKIGTYNPQTNRIEFYSPNGDILLHDYSGPMYHFKNRNVDVLVTPDHDMWMGRPLWKDRTKWEKIHADQIDIQGFKFLSGGLNWLGIEPEDFLLPYVPYKCYSEVPNRGPFNRINISTWLEFLGYYVSEGCLAKGKGKWAVTLSQNSLVNFDKTEKIRQCLQKLPFKFLEYTNPSDHTTRFWIHCKSLYLYLEENCGDYSYLKHFPSEVLQFNTKYLRIAFEAAMTGDGTSDSREDRTSRTYYSTSDQLLDQIQEIALKLGYRAHILLGSGCKRVCISESSVSNIREDQVSIEDYSGKVYCFNVPNHLFITRREGRVGIHGNTADSMSRNLVDDVKYYQRVLEIFVNDYIIKELLLESTFENPLDEENIVRLEFREVDLDAKIKVENHAIQAFASHVLTQAELRKAFGKEPLTDEEWEDTYWKLIMEPENLIRAVDEPYLVAQGAIDNPNTSLTPEQSTEAQGKAEQQAEKENDLEIKKIKAKPKLSSGQRQAASRSRPSNQHGRALGPTKRKSNFEPGFTFDEINPILETYDNLFQNAMYSLTKGTFTHEWIRHIATTARQQMTDNMTRLVRLDFRKGLKRANYEAGQSEIDVPIHFLENRISSSIARLMDSILKQLDNTKTREIVPSELEMYVSSVFDSLRFRSTSIYISERVKAYNYGVLIGLQKRGIGKAKVINNETGCEECQRHNESIPLLNATINDIPGFHPNCKCVIEEDKL